MTLLSVRTDFIKFCARYDLVEDDIDYIDAGADKFIRAGQRWLDRTFEIAKARARWYNTTEIGSWYALVPNCRVITQVWMSNSTNNKWRLERKDADELHWNYRKDPSLITNGKSRYYSLVDLRTIPEEMGTTIIDIWGTTIYDVDVDHYDYLGLVWMAPALYASSLEVHGLFYQPILTENDSTNFWTESEPHALQMAACRALEDSYRNIQGVNDWTNSIREYLIGLEYDFADLESTEVHQMEG